MGWLKGNQGNLCSDGAIFQWAQSRKPGDPNLKTGGLDVGGRLEICRKEELGKSLMQTYLLCECSTDRKLLRTCILVTSGKFTIQHQTPGA